jgi:hypothetical protein
MQWRVSGEWEERGWKGMELRGEHVRTWRERCRDCDRYQRRWRKEKRVRGKVKKTRDR